MCHFPIKKREKQLHSSDDGELSTVKYLRHLIAALVQEEEGGEFVEEKPEKRVAYTLRMQVSPQWY